MYIIVVLRVLAAVPARPGTGIKPTTAYRPGSALKPYAVERLRPGTRQGARQAAAGTGGARPGSGRRAAEATRPGRGSSSSRPGTAQRLGTAGNSFSLLTLHCDSFGSLPICTDIFYHMFLFFLFQK